MHLIKIIFFSIIFGYSSMFSQVTLNKNYESTQKFLEKPDPKAHYFALGVQGAIVLGGFYFWNYSDRWTGRFMVENEGMFRKDSYNGGADKLGHMYTWALLTRALAHNYERHGFTKKSSIFWGFTIPAFNGVLVELLDGYTDYNASTEDILFNLMGSGLGAFLYLHPKLDKTIHLDWSYLPSSDFKKNVKRDFTTDYAGSVFTLELNGNGLKEIIGYQNPLITDYFQLGLSYYSRGYSGELNTNKQRFIGLTLGINFQQFFKEETSLKTFLKYYKLPYSFGGYFKELNSGKLKTNLGKDIYNY